MKVKELIEKLQNIHPETEIFLARDPEGNGFAPLDKDHSEAIMVKDGSREYSFYDPNWDADDACLTEQEWNRLLKKKRAVVFWPNF